MRQPSPLLGQIKTHQGEVAAPMGTIRNKTNTHTHTQSKIKRPMSMADVVARALDPTHTHTHTHNAERAVMSRAVCDCSRLRRSVLDLEQCAVPAHCSRAGARREASAANNCASALAYN